MFKGLRNKLKGALKGFSKKVDEELEDSRESVQEPRQAKQAIPEPQEKIDKEEDKRQGQTGMPKTTGTEEKEKKQQITSKGLKERELKEKKSDRSSQKKTPPASEKKKAPQDHAQTRISKESSTKLSQEAKSKNELKKELKETPDKTDDADNQITPVVEEEPKKGFLSKVFRKKEAKQKKEEPQETGADEKAHIEKQEDKQKKGILGKVQSLTKISISEKKFEELFWDIELALLENNVALEVVEKIKEDLKQELTTGKTTRQDIDTLIRNTLKKSIMELFDVEERDIFEEVKQKTPYIIAFIGVNGCGKTTQLAKLAKKMQDKGLSCVIAAADTFRAAAIQQLEEHANNLGIKMIKQDYNADPAAVAYDAVQHAKSKGIDIVLVDTAGRLHSNDNLMNELKKLIRVNEPDMKIFVGESITGNDCVEQAKLFDEAIGIDAIILSKADVDEKGGAAVSVSFVTGKPILYIGTGQSYDDLKEFDKEIIMESLGL